MTVLMRVVGVGLVCTVLAGCETFNPVTLVNPYVAAPKISVGDGAPVAYPDKRPLSEGEQKYNNLLSARKDAAQVGRAYVGAATTPDVAKNLITLITVPFVADAIYNTLIHPKAGKRLTTGVGIGVGAAVVLGDILISSKRQTVYLAGEEALQCAVSHSTPYLIEPTDYALYFDADLPKSFAAAATLVNGDLTTAAAVQKQVADASANPALTATDGAPLTAASSALDVAVKAANDAVGATTTLKTNLSSLKTRVDGAAPNLEDDVGKVERSVTQQIVATEPSVDDIKSAIAGFAPVTFAGASAATPAAAAATPQDGKRAGGANPAEMLAALHLDLFGDQTAPAKSAAAERAAKAAAQAAAQAAAAAIAMAQKLDLDVQALKVATASASGFVQGVSAAEQKAAAPGPCALSVLPNFSVDPPTPAEISAGHSLVFLVVAPTAPTVKVDPAKGATADITAAVSPPITPAAATVGGSQFVITLTATAAVDSATTPRKVTVTAGASSSSFDLTVTK